MFFWLGTGGLIILSALCWYAGRKCFRQYSDANLKRLDYYFIGGAALSALVGFSTLTLDQATISASAQMQQIQSSALRLNGIVKRNAMVYCGLPHELQTGAAISPTKFSFDHNTCKYFSDANVKIATLPLYATPLGDAYKFRLDKAHGKHSLHGKKSIFDTQNLAAAMTRAAAPNFANSDGGLSIVNRDALTAFFLLLAAVLGGFRLGKQSVDVERASDAPRVTTADASAPRRKRAGAPLSKVIANYLGRGPAPEDNASDEARIDASKLLDGKLNASDARTALLILDAVKETVERRRTAQRTLEGKATSIVGFATAVAVFTTQFDGGRAMDSKWGGFPVILIAVFLEFFAILSGVLVLQARSADLHDASPYNSDVVIEGAGFEARVACSLIESWAKHERELKAHDPVKIVRFRAALWSFIGGVFITLVVDFVHSLGWH